jgi:peroxiredoxin
MRIFANVKFRLFSISSIFLISAVYTVACEPPTPVQIGQKPPGLSLYDLKGNLRTLQQEQGKVVVLCFWAEGCCGDKNLISLGRVFQTYKDKGFVILAVNAGEPKAQVEKFVRRTNIAYDILLDERFAAMKEYGIATLPMLYILDRQGIVRKKIFGQGSPEYLERAILELL